MERVKEERQQLVIVLYLWKEGREVEAGQSAVPVEGVEEEE